MKDVAKKADAGRVLSLVRRSEEAGAGVCGVDRKHARTMYRSGPHSVGPNRVVVCSYLVDPASSHMLVSKIKPCMSKYKHLYCETANGSLNQLSFI